MRKYSLIIFFLTLTIISCERDATNLLDKEEVNDIYFDQVFTNAQYSFWFLTTLYEEMPSGGLVFGGAGLLGNGIDEGQCKANWDNAHRMAIGDWGPTRLPLNYNPWNKFYSAIRKANMFLENVQDIPDADEPFINESIRQRMKGEALFIRALYHYELLKFYGGVPIISQVLTQYDEDLLFQERPDYDELVEFICTEAENAALLVPHQAEYAEVDFGRITKGACWALISRTRLFAASPLFNDASDPEPAPWRGAYNPDKWVLAAEAARKVITETNNAYSLHLSTSPNSLGHYEDLFTKRYSPEIILSYQHQNSRNNNEVHYERFCLPGRFFNYGHGVINNLPVMNLVADYEAVVVDGSGNVIASHLLGMEKLKQIYASGVPDPVSGFDPQKPYTNRDPRFYMSIWYNGVNWPARSGITFETWEPDPTSTLPSTPARDFLSGWYNTGFFHRKFVNPYANYNGWGTNLNQTHNWPIFRYAEILLNYAEAVNEAFGNPDVAPAGYPMSPREAINIIRQRAVFPAYSVARVIPAGMPVNAMGRSMPPIPEGLSQSQMRERIRQERRIELAFEEHRYFDVRRWKIAKQAHEQMYRQLVYKQNDGSIKYGVDELVFRPWQDKFNFFPIMELELRKNPKLLQNPYW